MSADLSQPLRDAIVASADIVALLATYAGEPAVFSSAPAPGNAAYPFILISDDVDKIEEDGLSDFRPSVEREISVYVNNAIPEKYRVADQVIYLVRTLFHRRRTAITVTGWHVVDIQVSGPVPTSQDDQTEGRVVTLTVRLAKLRT